MKYRYCHIYCDESYLPPHPFMVLGGIVIHASALDEVIERLKEYRAETGLRTELKWSHVSEHHYENYKQFLDYFFFLNKTNRLHFKSIVIEKALVDHKKFNRGDKEAGFYKFYHYLIREFTRVISKNDNNYCFNVFLDHRTTNYNLANFKRILNIAIGHRFQDYSEPIHNVHSIDSRAHDIAQINDLLIGAIGFLRNGMDRRPEAKKAKINLANYIISQAGIRDVNQNTSLEQREFRIWQFPLQKK